MANSPNILMLVSDQHNANVLGCADNAEIETPNLDALADGGIIFDNAYCQGPLCVPSRTSLITGQYCRNHGVYDNRHVLEHNRRTFPRVLSAHGYRTCLIGKAHFNGEQYHGYQQRPYGDLWGQAHQPDPCRVPENGDDGFGDIIRNSGPSSIPLALTQTEVCVAETARWLQQHRDLYASVPFLLSVHFDKPHFPLNPPKPYFERYVGKVSLPEFDPGFLRRTVPFVQKAAAFYQANRYFPTQNTEADHLRALAAYYGCVTWVDNAIGRILDILRYLGFYDRTIVIYTSDHGDMLGHHGLWQKTVFYEGSSRVPLIMAIPGLTKPGRRASELVGQIDLFPTLCDLIGIEQPVGCDGINLHPILEGRRLNRDEIFSESVVLKSPDAAGCMIRSGSFKYNYYLDGTEELYDLAQDPSEAVNCAADPSFASIKAELRARVIRFWEPEHQLERYQATPMMTREKHFFEWSNQFVGSDGTIINARP